MGRELWVAAALAGALGSGCGSQEPIGRTEWAQQVAWGCCDTRATAGADGTLALPIEGSVGSIGILAAESGDMTLIERDPQRYLDSFAVDPSGQLLIAERDGNSLHLLKLSPADGQEVWDRVMQLPDDVTGVWCGADRSGAAWLVVGVAERAMVDLGGGPLDGKNFLARFDRDGELVASRVLLIVPEHFLPMDSSIAFAAATSNLEGYPVVRVVAFGPDAELLWTVNLEEWSRLLGYDPATGEVIAAPPGFIIGIDSAGEEAWRRSAGVIPDNSSGLVLAGESLIFGHRTELTTGDPEIPLVSEMGPDGEITRREIFLDGRGDFALLGTPGGQDYFILGQAIGNLDLHDATIASGGELYSFAARRILLEP